MNPLDFSGRHVCVFGGTSGINLGVAERFAQHGARVSVASRTPEKIDAAVARLQALGAEAAGFRADVRNPAEVGAALEAAVQQFGPIDVLVSGAAGNFPAPAESLSTNGFKAVVDIDLLGTFHVLRAAFAHLRKPGAAIINISAPQAWVPMPLQVHVCAAKAGVDMVTRVLALEWGAHGVRVNSIAPGPIDGTEGMERLAPTPQLHDLVRSTVPLGRTGVPADIGNAALFLASPLASYVSGVVLPVDGAWALAGATVAMHGLAQAATATAAAAR